MNTRKHIAAEKKRCGSHRIWCCSLLLLPDKFQFSKQTHNIIHLKRSWQRPVPRHETLHKNMKKVMFLLAVGVMCLTACAQKKGGERGTRQGGHMVINKDSVQR